MTNTRWLPGSANDLACLLLSVISLLADRFAGWGAESHAHPALISSSLSPKSGPLTSQGRWGLDSVLLAALLLQLPLQGLAAQLLLVPLNLRHRLYIFPLLLHVLLPQYAQA